MSGLAVFLLASGSSGSTVAGSLTGSGSIAIPVGVSSITLTGRGGTGSSGVSDPGQPYIAPSGYHAEQPAIAAVAGQPYIAPYYTNPGQPEIAPSGYNAGQPYIAPSGYHAGQEYIPTTYKWNDSSLDSYFGQSVEGWGYIEVPQGQFASAYINAAVSPPTYVGELLRVAIQVWQANDGYWVRYWANVVGGVLSSGQPFIAAYYDNPGQQAIAPYYTNPGQAYVAPSGYNAGQPAIAAVAGQPYIAAYYDSPGQPYVAPSSYDPGQPYIAPSGFHAEQLFIAYNPGQPYIAPTAAQAYVAPTSGQPYIASVDGQPYIAPFQQRTGWNGLVRSAWIANPGGNDYNATLSAGEGTGATPTDRVDVIDFSNSSVYSSGTNTYTYFDVYVTNPGQPAIAYNPGQDYIAPTPGQPAIAYNPGQPYIAPTPGQSYIAAYYDNPGQPYIAPSSGGGIIAGAQTSASINGNTGIWLGGAGGVATESTKTLASHSYGQLLTYSVGAGGSLSYSYQY